MPIQPKTELIDRISLNRPRFSGGCFILVMPTRQPLLSIVREAIQ